MFSCKHWEIFKNTYLQAQLWKTAFDPFMYIVLKCYINYENLLNVFEDLQKYDWNITLLGYLDLILS